jgi:hypothetical protein
MEDKARQAGIGAAQQRPRRFPTPLRSPVRSKKLQIALVADAQIFSNMG